MPEFHDRLRDAMTTQGLTQTQLCAKTKIPKSAMSQYLSGAFKPKQTRTYLIARALNVSEAWLMGFDAEIDYKTKTNQKPPSAIDREIVDAFSRLSDEKKKEAINYLQYLHSQQDE